MIPELAAKRISTMRPNWTNWLRTAEDFPRGSRNSRPTADYILDLRCHVDVDRRRGERAREWACDAAARMADNYARDTQAVLTSYPDLRRRIANMMITNRSGALGFDQPPAAPTVRLQNVRSHDHVLVLEGGFENGTVP